MAGTFPKVGSVGVSLMSITSAPSRKFTQRQFNDMFRVNAGEFYGNPDRHENLKLIGGFFAANPTYADKIYLSVKGGADDHWVSDPSPESLRASLEATDKYLAPLYQARKKFPKTLDIYTLAEVREDSIEDAVSFLDRLRQAGKFTKLCISEPGEETLEKAANTAQVDAVEAEYSVLHRDPEENGLFSQVVGLGIPVIASSPLGKGVLVGQRLGDLPKDDFRVTLERFVNPAVMKSNDALVDRLKSISNRLSLTPSQVALSWITTLSGSTHGEAQYPLLIPVPGSTSSEHQRYNLNVRPLDSATLKEITAVIANLKKLQLRSNLEANDPIEYADHNDALLT